MVGQPNVQGRYYSPPPKQVSTTQSPVHSGTTAYIAQHPHLDAPKGSYGRTERPAHAVPRLGRKGPDGGEAGTCTALIDFWRNTSYASVLLTTAENSIVGRFLTRYAQHRSAHGRGGGNSISLPETKALEFDTGRSVLHLRRHKHTRCSLLTSARNTIDAHVTLASSSANGG